MNGLEHEATQAVLGAASAAAARGEYDTAAKLLQTAPSAPAERFLLEGQVAAQQGRYEEAERAFAAVPPESPHHPLAQRALARAQRARRAPLFARHARAAAAALGVVALGAGTAALLSTDRPSGRTAMSDGPAAALPRSGPAPAPAAPVPAVQTPPLPLARVAPTLHLVHPGLIVRNEERSVSIGFESGMFERGSAEIRPDRLTELDAVVHALRESTQSLRVEVSGYTDPSPMRAGRTFEDNTDLAAARAWAVANYLRKRRALPVEKLGVGVGGTGLERLHGGGEVDHARQRTVVMRVSLDPPDR